MCFAAPFAGTQLTVTVQRVSYSVDGAGNIESTQTPDNGFYVSLYSTGTGAGSFDAADYLQSKKTGEGDQGAGNAVFDFPSTHTLTIVKQCADVASAGQTFLFKVTKLAEGDGEEQSRTVSITLPSSATDSNGSSVFEAQAQLSVPSGSYRVEEVNAWAWRYSTNILVGGVSSSTGEVGVSAATSTNDATVTFINEKANGQWLAVRSAFSRCSFACCVSSFRQRRLRPTFPLRPTTPLRTKPRYRTPVKTAICSRISKDSCLATNATKM